MKISSLEVVSVIAIIQDLMVNEPMEMKQSSSYRLLLIDWIELIELIEMIIIT